MKRLLSVCGFFACAFVTVKPCAAAPQDRVREENAQRVAKELAANPTIQSRSRIPYIKVLKIVGDGSVYVKTQRLYLHLVRGTTGIGDRYYIEGETGKLKLDPAARAPNELTFSAGESCCGPTENEFQNLTLLKIENGKAVFHLVAATSRSGQETDEFISVAPYEDARWQVNPTDKTEVTYTEFDEAGKKKIENNLKNDKLNGTATTWYSNGQKESEGHYENDVRNGLLTEWYSSGQKRHEAFFKDGKITSQETYWNADGRISTVRNYP